MGSENDKNTEKKISVTRVMFVELKWERLEPVSKNLPRALENLHGSSLSEECMFDRGLICSVSSGYFPQTEGSPIRRIYIP
jgi:hypothetical protein